MKPILSILITLLITSAIVGQHSHVDFCDIIRHSIEHKSTDSITHLLQLDSTHVNNSEKAELYYIRGRLIVENHEEEIERRSKHIHPKLKEAHRDLSLAINQVPSKDEKLEFVFKRFQVLERYKPYYEEYDSDLKLIESNGYKHDKFGIGFSAKNKYDGDFWLGGELSIGSGYGAPYTLKDASQRTIKKNRTTLSASILTLGYVKNIQTQSLNDFNFSLIRMEAPFYIDLLQVGFIDTKTNNYWYYRPEIGIGYSIFHLSAGYNFFFKSERFEDLSNAMINIRIKHVF